MVAARREGWTEPNNNNNNNRHRPAYNNLGVTKPHSACLDYHAGTFCLWCAPSPKKELSITLFSVKYEPTSIAVDYYRLLTFSINIDQYRLLYCQVLRNVGRAARE
jgi:hypothetical protein